MKKIIFAIFVVLAFLSIGNVTKANYEYKALERTIILEDGDVLRVEYVSVDTQWYKITYYTDGTIGVEPVLAPIED